MHTRFFLLPAVFATSFFTSCKESAEVRSPAEKALEEARVASLEAKLELLTEELASEQELRKQDAEAVREARLELEKILASPSETVVKKSEKGVKPLAEMPTPVSKMPGKTKPLESRAAARDRASVRLAAIGESFANLTTNGGKDYENLTITRVDDIGVAFRHSGGIVRIPFDQLPASWQDRFDYDADRARSARGDERMAEVNRNRAIQANVAATEKRRNEVARRTAALVEDEARRISGRVNSGILPDFPSVDPRVATNVSSPYSDSGWFRDYYYDPPVFQNGYFQEPYCPPIVQTPILRLPIVKPRIVRNPTEHIPVIRPTRPETGGNTGITIPDITVNRPPSRSNPSRQASQVSRRQASQPAAQRSRSIPSRTNVQPSRSRPVQSRPSPTVSRPQPAARPQPSRPSPAVRPTNTPRQRTRR